MYQLVESIRLLNGRFSNLEYHQARINRAASELMQIDTGPELTSYLHSHSFPKRGLYKCRVIYDSSFKEVQFLKYRSRFSHSLKVVYDDTVDYAHKYLDRSQLDELFKKRGNADDILIVKSGMVTDSYFHNIILYDGQRWFTPDTPLLRGTMRQKLLDQSTIFESRIKIEEVKSFQKVKLINAMVGIGGPEIDVSEIVF